jgi:hypothetical protein
MNFKLPGCCFLAGGHPNIRIDVTKVALALAIGLRWLPAPCGQRPTVHLVPAGIPIPSSYFGLHIHTPTNNTWPQVPFHEWRLWDSKATVWYNLEPKKGHWDFTQLDRDVDIAEQRKVGLLLTLGQSPPWASSRPGDPPSWRPGGPAPPTDEKDWQHYVRTVATRYRGRIHEYEVWNEPNLKQFYSGTREQLLLLAKDAYSIIHEVDPTAVVVSPSVTGAYDVGWFKHYLELGGGKYADVIGYHVYTSPNSPESAVETIREVRAAMLAHGVDKPLWNTESGYIIQSDFERVTPPRGSLNRLLTHREALAYVMRAYLLNWATGVSRLYWYDWDSNSMGLGDELGKRSKPAAAGYAAIEQWLNGAVMQSCDHDADDNWICHLTVGDRIVWIVWNADKPITRAVPASWKVTRADTVSASGAVVSTPIGRDREIVYDIIPKLLH